MAVSMDLAISCNSCFLSYRNPSIHRNLQSLKRRNYLRIRSELQTSQGVSNGAISIPTHKVTVHDRQRDVIHDFVVPEDQYILHTAESQNITLPFACRHGIVPENSQFHS